MQTYQEADAISHPDWARAMTSPEAIPVIMYLHQPSVMKLSYSLDFYDRNGAGNVCRVLH